MKSGVYMFVNSSLYLVNVDEKKKTIEIDAPDYLSFWIELDVEKFLFHSVYLGEL